MKATGHKHNNIQDKALNNDYCIRVYAMESTPTEEIIFNFIVAQSCVFLPEWLYFYLSANPSL